MTFSKPVYQLIVTGSGSFFCSGEYGGVEVHNARGDNVEQKNFTLSYPDDCGWDNVSCCLADTLQFPGGIASLVITSPEPSSGEVCYPPPSDTCDSAYVNIGYSYSLYEKRPATVSDCLTGDELLDQQAMRDFLLDEWTNYAHPELPASDRREVRGWLFEDASGNLVHGIYPDNSAIFPDTVVDTPCASDGVPTSPQPGYPEASAHPHPFAPRDTLPLNCFKNPTPRWRYDTATYGGASGPDIGTMQEAAIPLYIIDAHNIYVFPVGTTLENAKTNVRVYPRVGYPTTGCGLP